MLNHPIERPTRHPYGAYLLGGVLAVLLLLRFAFAF